MTIELKDIATAVQALKTTAEEKLDDLCTKQSELQARLHGIEQLAVKRPEISGGPAEPSPGSIVAKTDLSALREGTVKSLRIPVKSFPVSGRKATITSAAVPGIPDRDAEIYGPLPRRTTVRDLMIVRRTQAGTIDYIKGDVTGAAAPQQDDTVSPIETEGAEKAEIELGFNLESARVSTIACWTPASRQVLDDTEGLLDYIDTTLLDALALTEESQILNGSGIGANLHGLMLQATAFNRIVSGDGPNSKLRRAVTQVQLARGVPSGVVVSPTGLEALELEQDAEGRYLVAITVTQDNGRAVTWRLPVVVTDAIAADQFLIGDFTRAARIYDRMLAHVEISLHHADFFVRNMVAILAEERLAMTVPRPDLLVRGTLY